MKTESMKWFVKTAVAGALSLAVATPAVFAQSSSNERDHNGAYSRDAGGDRNSGDRRDGDNSYRENQRVSVQGRVTAFTRDRDGYRIQLDSGRDSYFVPQSYFRGRDLRVGAAVVLGGIFRGGAINIDAVSWPGDSGAYDRGAYDRGAYDRGNQQYQQQYVRGVVDRVDRRDGTLRVRDQSSGRMITVAVSGDSGSGLGRLRRGNRVEVSGNWDRSGMFNATSIRFGR